MLQKLAPELFSATPGDLRAAKVPDLRAIITVGEESATAWMLSFKKPWILVTKFRLQTLTQSQTHLIK